jgi:hypothetical protein
MLLCCSWPSYIFINFCGNPASYRWLELSHGNTDQTVLLFTFRVRNEFYFYFFYLSVVRRIFFSVSFCRNDENQFRVCVPSGNKTNSHPRLAGRFITLPFQEIHNKRSFILWRWTYGSNADTFFFVFVYFTRESSVLCMRILGFHIFEIMIFVRILPRVIIVTCERKAKFLSSNDTFPGIG